MFVWQFVLGHARSGALVLDANAERCVVMLSSYQTARGFAKKVVLDGELFHQAGVVAKFHFQNLDRDRFAAMSARK